MKIKFLGTAAAEGIPAMFCRCSVCSRSLEAGGRNIRTRSQAVVDDCLLIDFPADTYFHVIHGSLALPKIRSCIVTHSHSDHLYPADFEMRRRGFAHLGDDNSPLIVYATAKAGEGIVRTIDGFGLDDEGRVLFCPVVPFVPFDAQGYKITPLPADHDSGAGAVIYLIEKNSKCLLYAHDTGYFPEEVWDYLAREKVRINFVSLDCTLGAENCRNGHMCFEVAAQVRDRLRLSGLLADGAVCCANHFSHNCLQTYDDMLPFGQKYGFVISYDNMETEF